MQMASQNAAEFLVGLLSDPAAPYSDRVRAARDLLDRAGLSPQQAIAISVEPKPFEVLLEKVHRGPRTRAVIPSVREDQEDIVDAEVVEEEGGGSSRREQLEAMSRRELVKIARSLRIKAVKSKSEAQYVDEILAAEEPPPRPTRSPHPPSSRKAEPDGFDYNAYDTLAEAVDAEARRRAATSPVREATSEPISSAYGTARGHRDPGDAPGQSEHNGLLTHEEAAAEVRRLRRRW